MFKFERFGGFNNKKNHIVQFKTRDKTLSPSILGVSSPNRNIVSTPKVDLFDFPLKVNPLIKPSTTAVVEKTPVVVEQRVELKENRKISPQAPPPPQSVTVTPLKPTSNTVEEKKEEEDDFDDDVFDFPATQDSKEIKLLVASRRSIIDKKAQKKSKTKKKTPSLKSSSSSDTMTTKKPNSAKAPKKKNVASQSVQQEEDDSIFDIFDFDLNPPIYTKPTPANHCVPPQQQQVYTPQLQQTTTFYNYYNTPSSIPSQPQPYINPHPVYPNNQNLIPIPALQPHYNRNPLMSINSMLLNDPIAFQQVNDFLNEAPPAPPPQQPLANISNIQSPQQQPKKRKRNLVAHLKSASGETASTEKGFDFLSDEEESLQLNSETSDIVPFREFIQKERSTSPELTYNQRMELELEAMMKSEFEKKEQVIEKQDQPSQRRPRYQPQNKLNVKVTFEKKK